MNHAYVRIAREQLDRWNRGEVDALIENGAPDFEFVPAIAGGVEGGSIHGAEEFRSFFAGLKETWESFELEAEEFREVGDRVLMLGRIRAVGRGSGVELDQPLYGVCWFRDGRPSRIQSFLDRQAAIDAASRDETGQ